MADAPGMKVHKPHVQPIKTGEFGPKLDSMKMQNNPLRAAYQTGHDLNESYKMPTPNASGVNHSYMRPTKAMAAPKLSGKQNKPAGPVDTGKNTM